MGSTLGRGFTVVGAATLFAIADAAVDAAAVGAVVGSGLADAGAAVMTPPATAIARNAAQAANRRRALPWTNGWFSTRITPPIWFLPAARTLPGPGLCVSCVSDTPPGNHSVKARLSCVAGKRG